MSLHYERECRAPAATVWRLYSNPRLWPAWAPHVRRGLGLGDPEVDAGRHGAVLLLGVIPVPVRVVAKQPDRSWSWELFGITMRHGVEETSNGSVISLSLHAPRPLELAFAATYGQLIPLLLGRLAAVAERASS
ncbi:MAG TPA: SRPBCC family protein [Solirubrobacteraceae bacterium]|jgi:hypothetical protein|nr:SRPBCC family protein [Solirubrobacteraceae bacterium]